MYGTLSLVTLPVDSGPQSSRGGLALAPRPTFKMIRLKVPIWPRAGGRAGKTTPGEFIVSGLPFFNFLG
jgi:hypothetical protein